MMILKMTSLMPCIPCQRAHKILTTIPDADTRSGTENEFLVQLTFRGPDEEQHNIDPQNSKNDSRVSRNMNHIKSVKKCLFLSDVKS